MVSVFLDSILPALIQTLQLWPYWKLVGAFLVGALGSAAYITALHFKFIGVNDEERAIILDPFKDRYSFRSSVNFYKCVWYSTVGGFIAVVFQFDVPNFVAVQSLILGATWPAVVSQFLSGRMVVPSRDELDNLRKTESSFDPTLKQSIDNLTSALRTEKIKKT